MIRLVQVNDKMIEVFQQGDGGTPILIVTGMGCSFEEWQEIAEELSESNSVLMFHRPGLGASEIVEGPRSTLCTVQEIEVLLHALGISEPIILVGHSYGGLCAQHFAKLNPSKLKAMILVDSTSVDFGILDELELPVMNGDSSDQDWFEKCSKYAEMEEQELKNVIEPYLDQSQQTLAPSIQNALLAFQQKPGLYKAMKAEVESWGQDARAIKELGGLDELPLTVIGRDGNHAVQQGVEDGFPESEVQLFENTWKALIKDQSLLSKNSRLVLACGSSHSIHLDRSDIVIEAIQRHL